MEKIIRVGKQVRSFTISRDDVNEERRTVSLSFSSETPVERWFGMEILDHSAQSVDLRRLKRGGALLIDHDPRNQVGVIEEVLIDEADRKGRAVVRFGRSAKAEEIFQDVLDGIRRNVSVSYQIHEMKLESSDKSGDTYRVTRWEPLEISIVSIPADINVGIGRSTENGKEIRVAIPDQIKKEEKMICRHCNKELIDGVCPDKCEERKVKLSIEAAAEAERARVKEIYTIGERFKCIELARKAIEEGKSIDAFKSEVLEKVAGKRVDIDPNIGLSPREIKQFSFVRAINALASRDWKGAEFERECSEAVAKRLNRTPHGIFIPNDVIFARDLEKGVASAGGYTVATELLAASFIELLRNRMMIRALGATILSGLVGDIAIPKQTGGATAYWVAESGAPTESQQAFGQVALTPKTVGAFTDISRKLLLQSSIDVENFVRADLATVLAIEIDRAAINGSGVNNQPTGILNASGLSIVAIGANGGDPTIGHIVDLESNVATANADVGSLAYLTNAKVRGKLKKTFINPTYGETRVWQDSAEAGFGMLNGYRAAVSNQVPSDLTKGTGTDLSAIIFGNFRDLIIGEWGALDLLVDPYTGGAAGTLRVRVLQDVDIAIRHIESFSAIKDAATT